MTDTGTETILLEDQSANTTEGTGSNLIIDEDGYYSIMLNTQMFKDVGGEIVADPETNMEIVARFNDVSELTPENIKFGFCSVEDEEIYRPMKNGFIIPVSILGATTANDSNTFMFIPDKYKDLRRFHLDLIEYIKFTVPVNKVLFPKEALTKDYLFYLYWGDEITPPSSQEILTTEAAAI